jgi:hypothetical protein
VRRKKNKKDKKLVSVNGFAICDKFKRALLAHQIFYFLNAFWKRIASDFPFEIIKKHFSLRRIFSKWCRIFINFQPILKNK